MKCELFGAVFHFCEGTLHLVPNVHFSVLFFISVWEHYITCGICMFSVPISLSVWEHYIPCGTVLFSLSVLEHYISCGMCIFGFVFLFCVGMCIFRFRFPFCVGTIPHLWNVHLSVLFTLSVWKHYMSGGIRFSTI